MKRLTLSALALFVVAALAACDDASADAGLLSAPETTAENRALAPGDESITEIVMVAASAESDPQFTLLLDAVLYVAATNPESALVESLFNSDQYTVFAPTDEAFVNLVTAVAGLLDPDVLAADGPFAAIDDYLGEGTVEAVVSYHVTEGRRAANSVVPAGRSPRSRTIETVLSGATFQVTSGGTIQAVGNTANIVSADISASNGIIHVIDAVILPVDLGL